MARPATVRRVHAAVLDLAQRGGPSALTMEGIAAEARVGKQTLYRSWSSVHAILFDALAAAPAAAEASPVEPSPAGPSAAEPSAAEPSASDPIEQLLRDAIDEISTEPRCSLLRSLAASIQADAALAREFHERLLAPQLAHIQHLVRARGADDPVHTTELLLAPIAYRWSMRLPQFDRDELAQHVRRLLPPQP